MKKLLAVAGGGVALAVAAVSAVVVAAFFLFGGAGLADSGTSSSNAGTGSSACTPASGVVVGPAATFTGLEGEQVDVANTIIQVGVQRGVPARGVIVAIATGLQESGLRNLTYGDRDSEGVFQQRPSQGWKNVRDVAYAAGAFYDTLLKVPGWESMPVTVAAQRTQRSGFPDAYAKWEPLAAKTVTAALGATAVAADTTTVAGCATTQPVADVVPVAATGVVAAIIAAGQTQLGVDYSWGGGTLDGPGFGTEQGRGISGFDCSSFVRYAVYQGTGGAVTLPRTTRQQYAAGTKVAKADLQPGDLLFFASNTSNPASIHHVGMFIGDGRMLHAPKTGDVVKVVPVDLNSGSWARQFIGATRPTAGKVVQS